MIKIPKNNPAKLIAEQNAKHQVTLDKITQRILDKLNKYAEAEIGCCEHAVGALGHFHLCDAIEVAKQFRAQGYYCYYCDYYNSFSVNQRAVMVRKTPMPEGDRRVSAKVWYDISRF